MRKTVVLVGAVVLGLAAAGVWAMAQALGPPPVVQPMAFNHKRHLQEEIACKDCHKQVEEGAHATIASIKACLLCHEESKGNHPDEPKVREYAKDGREIPWAQANRLVGHVYFSHAAHTAYAKMDCRECHGEMKDATEAVTRSQIDHLTMSRCMACHEEKGVSNDCLMCHK